MRNRTIAVVVAAVAVAVAGAVGFGVARRQPAEKPLETAASSTTSTAPTPSDATAVSTTTAAPPSPTTTAQAARVTTPATRRSPPVPRIDQDGVWVIRPSGSAERIYRAATDEILGRTILSPSSALVAVQYTAEGGFPKLAVVDVATRRVLRPTADAWIDGIGWSDDDHLIVLENASPRLERVQVRTGRRTTIWEGDDEVRSFVVSPDGRQVAFRRDCPCDTKLAWRHALWAVGSDGSNARRLLSPLHYLDHPQAMVFAPDSRRVALLAGGRRSIVDVVTGTETVLAASPQYFPPEPHEGTLHNLVYDQVRAWSPASDWVAFSHDELVLYRADGTGTVNGIGYPSGFGLGPAGRFASTKGLSGREDLRVTTLPEVDGTALLSSVHAALWPPAGDLYAVAPESQTIREGRPLRFGLWRVAGDGPPRLVARLPPAGNQAADHPNSTITLNWSEERPDGRQRIHSTVVVIMPR